MSRFSFSLRRFPMIILAVLLVISTGCLASDKQSTSDSDVLVASAKGAQAPDFTLGDLNGDEVSLSKLRGQPVLINFWATW